MESLQHQTYRNLREKSTFGAPINIQINCNSFEYLLVLQTLIFLPLLLEPCIFSLFNMGNLINWIIPLLFENVKMIFLRKQLNSLDRLHKNSFVFLVNSYIIGKYFNEIIQFYYFLLYSIQEQSIGIVKIFHFWFLNGFTRFVMF